MFSISRSLDGAGGREMDGSTSKRGARSFVFVTLKFSRPHAVWKLGALCTSMTGKLCIYAHESMYYVDHTHTHSAYKEGTSDEGQDSLDSVIQWVEIKENIIRTGIIRKNR